MTMGGKQFLGLLFLALAIGRVIGFAMANKNYDEATQLRAVDRYRDTPGGYALTLEVSFDRPPPKPLFYFGAAGAFQLASFVAFNSAAATRTEPGRHEGGGGAAEPPTPLDQ